MADTKITEEPSVDLTSTDGSRKAVYSESDVLKKTYFNAEEKSYYITKDIDNVILDATHQFSLNNARESAESDMTIFGDELDNDNPTIGSITDTDSFDMNGGVVYDADNGITAGEYEDKETSFFNRNISIGNSDPITLVRAL